MQQKFDAIIDSPKKSLIVISLYKYKKRMEQTMTEELLEFIKKCIAEDNMHAFYIKTVWKNKRQDIIKRDHCECQCCKRNGKIKVVKIKTKRKSERAYVHHIKHLRDYPELALEDSNLETLCFNCHELEHIDDRFHFENKKEGYVNEERW